MIKTILITGARSFVALNLAREFHKIGYEVHVADSSSAYISRYSNSVSKFHKYASPKHKFDDFKIGVKDMIKNIKPDLIIPTCEEIFYLAQALSESERDKLFAPSLEILRKLHDKFSFVSLCRDLKINVPETFLLESEEGLENYRDNSNNFVFKPCFSRFGSQAIIKPKFKNLSEIHLEKSNPWLAQEFIKGEEFSFYAVARKGNVSALSIYGSSWRISGGASYVFTSSSKKIFDQTFLISQNIASKLMITGQFSCDFIIDEKGKLWLIECNPRSTSGLCLLVRNGLLAKHIIQNREETLIADNIEKHILPMMLTYGFMKSVKERKLRKWISIIRENQDVISVKEDRMPLLGSLLDTVIFSIRALKNGLSLTRSTTFDIEWNGESLEITKNLNRG